MQNNKEIYQKELEKRDKTIEALLLQVEILTQQLTDLKRLVFGSKHERFVPGQNPAQLSLGFESEQAQPQAGDIIEQAESVTTQAKAKTRTIPENPPVRTGLPANLRREIIDINPEEDITGLKMIGYAITEVLEINEPEVYVKQYRRAKYVRTGDNGIAIGKLPELPLPKAMAGPSLLANILISKFVDHLPIYRQVKRFDRYGIEINDATINDWIKGTCNLLQILYDRLIELILACEYIQLDETPVKVLDSKKKGTTHRGYFWVSHSPELKLTLFQYDPGRGSEYPKELLKNFIGKLQTDGYRVYEDFGNNPNITLLGCMAHARRYFEKALGNDKTRAEYFLTQLHLLYNVEEQIRENKLNPVQILELRKKDALPVLKQIKVWLLENITQVTPSSSIGQAIAYSLKRWDKLMVYASEAHLQIDNNLVENTIRPVAIGRKNYMFAGSQDGAQRNAMIYTFVDCCIRHNVNPEKWLTDVLTKLPSLKINQIDSLLPQNWVTPVEN